MNTIFDRTVLLVELMLGANGLALHDEAIPNFIFDCLAGQRGKAMLTLYRANRHNKMKLQEHADFVDLVKRNAIVIRNDW